MVQGRDWGSETEVWVGPFQGQNTGEGSTPSGVSLRGEEGSFGVA